MTALHPVRQIFSDWVALLRYAPAILSLAMLGEFLQHIAEVSLGMFASRAAFIELQGSAVRFAFGLIKITSLMIAMSWAARWLARRNQAERPGLGGPVDWPRFLVPNLIAVPVLLAIAFAPIDSTKLRLALLGVVLIVSWPWSRMSMDAMFGIARRSLRDTIRKRPMAPIMSVLGLLPLFAMMKLHFLNHDWAFGSDLVRLWGLMVWDSLLVGLIALWSGALLYGFYRPPTAA